MIRQTTFRISHRPPAWRRGETKKANKENAGAMIRETNVKTLPRTARVVNVAGGGRHKEGEHQHEMER